MTFGAGERISVRGRGAGSSVECMQRVLTRQQLTLDLALAGSCFLLLMPLTLLVGNDARALPILAVFAVGVAFRRLNPGAALGIAWLATVAQLLAVQSPIVADIAIPAVVYATAAHGDRIVRWLGFASVWLGALVAAGYLTLRSFYLPPVRTQLEGIQRFALEFGFFFVLTAAVLGLSWTAGLLARTVRRAREGREAQRAAELEAVKAEEEVAVEQERNRIARDMHDVVAHSLAVVIAQADGARYAARDDPGAVDTALGRISSTAREALGEVRILLAQLRHDQVEGPQPVLDDLGGLLDQFRRSGLEVAVRETGSARELGSGRQLAVYRIVQEALTNALRHGETSEPVEVGLDWGEEAVTVTVGNAVGADVRSDGASVRATGHGLAGMRERAVLAGGSLNAGAVGARYEVRAVIPLGEGTS